MSSNRFVTGFTLKLKVTLLFCIAACAYTPAMAQMPTPGPEMDVLKRDVGEWTCDIKVWPQPGADPVVSKGKESTQLFKGGYWTITNFTGVMMGNEFDGHGSTGYDAKKKKYVGTWLDSMGPTMMHTEGTYDKETETLTMSGDAPGPDGVSTSTYTMATCYKGGKRVMTMYMQPKDSGDEQKAKFFEITYSKK